VVFACLLRTQLSLVFTLSRQSLALVLTTKLETNRMKYGKTLKKTQKYVPSISRDEKNKFQKQF